MSNLIPYRSFEPVGNGLGEDVVGCSVIVGDKVDVGPCVGEKVLVGSDVG